MTALKRYLWPGNVRELENAIQRIIVMNDEEIIDVPHLPAPARYSAAREAGVNRTLAEVEAAHIRSVLAHSGDNRTRASEILDIDRKTLREKMKRYKLG
jgi:DNA-binding NtrC family response regulator